ncbi:MAG: hypothetical protein DI536_29320 [Archangium gephyra]|uniref:DUF4261 domain-containing protein n=1 Tax=Archangium gephyra TaxID=48 RepID=A0A2W5V9Z2_9BACT|nr:MAG: hypothetical protein DI536_29320 [Archangium gephyra]
MIWPRPLFAPTGAVSRCSFLVFSPTEFPALQPGEGVQWGFLRKDKTPEMFARMETLAQGAHVSDELLETLQATQFAGNVQCEATDPKDLGYLQACWAAVRSLVDSSATVVLDVESGNWLSAEDVRARPETFTFENEVSLHTFPVHGEPWWSIHTNGMGKFGRHELILFVPSEGEHDLEADVRTGNLPSWTETVLVKFASDSALGLPIEVGTRLQFGSMFFTAERCEPGRNAPEQLDENFLVLVNQESRTAFAD